MGNSPSMKKQVVFIIVVTVAVFAVIMAAIGALPTGYKYQGLTEQQIKAVEAFRDACDTQTFFAEGSGSDAADRVAQKCDQVEAQKIADFRAKNSSS